jgi:uncharacterized protein (TIGR03086 family)
MTNDTTSPTSPAALVDAPFGASDPRAMFARAVALGGGVIGAVRPEQLGDPTPCTEYDVRALLDHMVMVLRRVAALGRGDDPFGPDVLGAPPVADDGWPQVWRDAASAVQAAWADDASLTRIVTLPWMQDTGAVALVAYLNEVTVHTWDLAAATGQRPAWDPEVLSLAFDGIRFLPATGRPALFAEAKANMAPEFRNWSDPFADAVPVPEDAPLIDRLVAWNGRDVAAWNGRDVAAWNGRDVVAWNGRQPGSAA